MAQFKLKVENRWKEMKPRTVRQNILYFAVLGVEIFYIGFDINPPYIIVALFNFSIYGRKE